MVLQSKNDMLEEEIKTLKAENEKLRIEKMVAMDDKKQLAINFMFWVKVSVMFCVCWGLSNILINGLGEGQSIELRMID